MRILGIDPGTAKIGFGVVDDKDKNLEFVKCGHLSLGKYSPEERLLKIFNQISKIIKETKPDIVGVEKVFFAKNKKTAIEVSEARGVVVIAAILKGKEVKSYTPLQVKQAVSSYGQTGKKGVQKMVRILLNLKEDPKPYDAADALAVAICCAQNMRVEG